MKETRQRNPFAISIKSLFQSLTFFGAILFIFITSFPPLEVETEINLSVHMAQHIAIVISGILIAYPLYRAGKFSRIANLRTGLVGFAILASLIVLWHLPTFWDAAVLNPLLHVFEHLSFLAIGLMIGAFVPMLPDNFKMLVLVLAISAHMFYGFALYLISTPIYPLYPVDQQALLGVFLFAPSPVYFVGFLYITLTRESKKLDFERHPVDAKIKRPSRKLGRFVAAALSILMIILLGGYLGLTVIAIGSSTSQALANTPVVYIVETPVQWQYSPQNITVVIGVNNTVEWISHSLAYDTVTSNSGIFSHSFSPGDAFTFTFKDAGVYDYYCAYHPWMKGTVVVLSS